MFVLTRLYCIRSPGVRINEINCIRSPGVLINEINCIRSPGVRINEIILYIGGMLFVTIASTQ